jgi:hypothetical protein
MQPYVCTFKDCENPSHLYETPEGWYNHEMQMHRKEWCCNIGDHRPYTNREDFLKHMRSSHSGSFLEHQLADVLEMCERPIQSTTGVCPLCTDDHEEYVSGELKIRRDTKEIPSIEMKRHLGRHLEQSALFAIPPSLRAADEDADIEANSQVLSEFRCEICEKNSQDHELHYCSQCDTVYCESCWNHQVVHLPRPDRVEHQRMDPYLTKRLEKIFAQPSSDEEFLKMLVEDEVTNWFGEFFWLCSKIILIINKDVERGSNGQSNLMDYGRLAAILASDSFQDATTTKYPHLVSFLGQTGQIVLFA